MISERDVRKYCYEDPSLIENYELAIADTKMWHCHHRVETIMHCGKNELIAQGCYENRPAHDLIFLTKAEHKSLHNFNNSFRRGKRHTIEAKNKMRKAHLGKKHTKETREKISNMQFGRKHTEETKIKMSKSHIGNKSCLGMHWYNNGAKEIPAYECPDGWIPGRLRKKK